MSEITTGIRVATWSEGRRRQAECDSREALKKKCHLRGPSKPRVTLNGIAGRPHRLADASACLKWLALPER
jgi:hypothetical protein